MTGPGDRGYDDALSSIRNRAEDLAVALAIWEATNDTRADAHARRAASGAIDAMLRALHPIRERLITEIRASDDATAVRVDKLLAESARCEDGIKRRADRLRESSQRDHAAARGQRRPRRHASRAGRPWCPAAWRAECRRIS
jgi:hypothetical protein